MTPYLQVENLTKSFGDLVLFNSISFGVVPNPSAIWFYSIQYLSEWPRDSASV